MYRTIQNQIAVPSKWEGSCRKGQCSRGTNRAVQGRNSAVTKNRACQTLNVCSEDTERIFSWEQEGSCPRYTWGETPQLKGKRATLNSHSVQKLNVSSMKGTEHKSFAKGSRKDSELPVAEEPSIVQKSENIPGTWESHASSSQKQKHLQDFKWQIQPEPF